MKQLRLVLVTRRFWPLADGKDRLMGEFADGLRQHGVATTVLTAQWEKRWPRRCVHREVPVVRLPMTRHKGLGKARYLRALCRWLREHEREFDVVLVSGLQEEAYAATGIADRIKAPVILRAESSGTGGDCDWQQRARFGRRVQRRCQAANAIIATSQQTVSELLSNGYSVDRVRIIANGTMVREPTDPQMRTAARSALADAHPVLQVPPQAPLVVFAGRFDAASHVRKLVEAWRGIAARWPTARLWLLGDGPKGPKIWARIKELELAEQIVLPGWFDDMEEILQAANLVVFPGIGSSTGPLLEAMASGVPVIASDIAEVREFIEHGKQGLLVEPDSADALSAAIQKLLIDNQTAAAFSAAARQRIEKDFTLDRMVDEHFELFERYLVSRQSTGTDQRSMLC